jgi:hypothetical protein
LFEFHQARAELHPSEALFREAIDDGSNGCSSAYNGFVKFGSDQTARRRIREAGQHYRGMTFTERGNLLLDVGSVRDGRIRLSQRGQAMRLLPETLSGIHQAWQDGNSPLDGKDNWECSTFSPGASAVDEVRCICPSKDQLVITDKINQSFVSVTREQLKLVVERIVDPWLASFSPASSAARPAQPAGDGLRRPPDAAKATPESSPPPIELP